MTLLTAATWRDANGVPVAFDGVTSQVTLTINANNTSVTPPIFGITGSVEVRAIYGVVTTALSNAITVAFWRLNDQTAQPAITLATGTTLSSAAAGSVIVKNGLAAAALTLINNSAGRVNEPTTLETQFFSPFTAVKKTAAVTNIEFCYSTTNAPATGAIQFFLRWIPLSADANITGLST